MKKVLGSVVVALLAVSLVSPAVAGRSTSTSNTDSFSATRTLTFAENGLCVTFTLDGTVSYAAVGGPRAIGGSARTFSLTKIAVEAPRLRAWTVAYDSAQRVCTSRPARYEELVMRQAWAGYDCGADPASSVEGAFAEPVADSWPGCRTKAAVYSSRYADMTRATQLRDDSTVRFARHVYSPRSTAPAKGPCLGGRVSFSVRTGSAEMTRSAPPVKVCLTPSFR